MTDQTDLPTTMLDGNAAAGALRTVFAVELTAALGQCDDCGQRAVLAEARLYTQAPGLVARCVDCGGVLFRVVTAPDRTWVDLRGLRSVEIGTTEP